jgi:hypothetical protein
MRSKQDTVKHYDSTAALGVAVEGPLRLDACFGRLRPHFTATRSPSISSPFAHACAAVSATARSLKFMKAHLE